MFIDYFTANNARQWVGIVAIKFCSWEYTRIITKKSKIVYKRTDSIAPLWNQQLCIFLVVLCAGKAMWFVYMYAENSQQTYFANFNLYHARSCAATNIQHLRKHVHRRLFILLNIRNNSWIPFLASDMTQADWYLHWLLINNTQICFYK